MIAAHHVTRIALAAVFLWAGIAKLVDVSGFAQRLSEFGLVPDALVGPAAWAVVLTELVLGVALACNIAGALALLTALLGAFIATLLYGISLGLDINCGCFGPGYHIDLKTQLMVDIGLLLACGFVYWSRRKCAIKTVDPRELVSKLVRSS